tara:strand:- start:1361 stop:2494 length:1134 start_codon:yes stop_codon:yes gene_type:complete
MAKSYQPLNVNTDVTTTRTLLHEVIPLTGTIISGTYGTFPDEENIKNYNHGMFQSVYDYPYLSSSANHIFDLSIGIHSGSVLSASGVPTQASKKFNMYNEFAQLLLGYDVTKKIEAFESDLNIADDTNQMKDCYFISLSRLLTKDQIKKGTFNITVGQDTWLNPFAATLTLGDTGSSETGGFKSGLPGGDYAILYDTTASLSSDTPSSSYGAIFYQAGVVVLSSSLWKTGSVGGGGTYAGAAITDFASGSVTTTGSTAEDGAARDVMWMMATSSISGACDAARARIQNISFNNSTEINSTIYFCRMPVNQFNYSSNPTYTTASKMVVKNVKSDMPVSYVTTIGLYNSANELLATAKLSEPLRKDPTNELTLRVRLDY